MLEKNDFLSLTESAMSASNPSLMRSNNYASIKFRVKYETITGQDVYILGDTKELGLWEPKNGLKMKTKDGCYPFWYCAEEIIFKVGTEIHYKYATVDSNTKELIWESNMSDRLFKVENKGAYEINEEKGNKSRKVNYNKEQNSINNKMIGYWSPINDKNVFYIKDRGGIDIEIRGSMCTSDDENNRLINMSIIDMLSYDQVKIDSMQKNPNTIGLKRKIELNIEEDKFIIVTALLPFKIKKLITNNSEIATNINNNISEKYSIIPTSEIDFYESLFNLKKESNYDIYWLGMLEDYHEYYDSNNKEEPIDQDLIDFLRKEKIFVVKPSLNEYNNYWIYMSHIMGKICYENKIPVYDDYFINYEKYFDAYKKISQLFAHEVINETNFDALMMIHDINLALVPHFIYTKNHFAKIGFYFNSLFPSLEVFKSLQYQNEIMQSILLCNLVCFHHIDIAMKFLGAVQRSLDLYYEIKPGGKIIINFQGRNVLIHIMQMGVDVDMIDNYLKKKELLDNCDIMKKKYKNISDNQKEKYIYFSIDGLLDINKIVIKFQAFDMFYDEYLKELNNIQNSTTDNMEEIIEENEENFVTNEANQTKQNINENSNTNKNPKADSKINVNQDNKYIINEKNINRDNKSEEDTKIINVIGKKEKSKSGINLSNPVKDPQSLKLEKQKNEIYKTKEPLFIQILISSESKLMNLYDFSGTQSESMKNLVENNYKILLRMAHEINIKYKKDIIICISEENFSSLDLFTLYSIGDCYYSLRKDYNFSIHIQSYVYASNYLNKNYDLIVNENSCLTPGIKGAQKVSDLNISQNVLTLKKVFPFNYINILMNENNINFIKNNQMKNWYKIFFSKLKKASFYDNDSPKKIIGFGLGFSLMKSNHNFMHLDKKTITDAYKKSNHNLIIIENNLLLQALEENNTYQKENIIYQLKTLASQEKNKIYIISGDTKSEVEQNLKDILPDIGISYEYGFYYIKPREQIIRQTYYLRDWSWKQAIIPILKGFTERTEGSYIIEKESMINWVYKNCYSDFGQFQANEMISHIKTLLFQNNSIIVEDDSEKNMVNIRPKNVNKGYFIAEILKQEKINGKFPEMILVIGDRDGGEEMFKYLNYLKYCYNEIQSEIISAIVPNRVSSANYYFNEVSEIWENIETFNKIDKNEDISSSNTIQDVYNMIEQSNDYELEILSQDNNFDNE